MLCDFVSSWRRDMAHLLLKCLSMIKILVVDDDKQGRGYLSRVLSEVAGFSVEVAETVKGIYA